MNLRNNCETQLALVDNVKESDGKQTIEVFVFIMCSSRYKLTYPQGCETL